MITATFLIKDNIYSITVFGHANYAERGKDIVCASVSSLTTAVVNEMSNYIDTIAVKGNDIQVDFRAIGSTRNPDKYHLVRLYEMLKSNLQEIEQQYPDNIKVVVESE